MGRITNIGRVSKSSIHNMYVHRNTTVENVGAVNPVEQVSRAENNINYTRSNYLLASDQFYDSLKYLKEEYKRFYHDEQNLERAMKTLESEKDEFFENMNNLIDKYNRTVKSLKIFDEVFHTNHLEQLKPVLDSFSVNFANIGIAISTELMLQIEEEKFKLSIKNSQQRLYFLFEPLKGFIKSLYRFFRSVNIPSDSSWDYKYGNLGNYLTGTIMDEKG